MLAMNSVESSEVELFFFVLLTLVTPTGVPGNFLYLEYILL